MSTVPATARKKLALDNYRIGWICPLHVELQAALAMLDEVHEKLPQPRTDPTVYWLGSINGHNIVIAGLHQPGNCTAAMVATFMQSTFRNLEFGLLVGIGGGVPTRSEAGMIRLGHVVVSKPKNAQSGAVYYSHGKSKDGVFERTGYINSPPVALLHAAQSLEIDLEAAEDCPISSNIERILSKHKLRSKYKHPGVSKDHMRGPEDEETDGIIVHRGTIASGELLLRDAGLRDKLAKEHGVLCFEMEAAGALTDFRCLVIRGISNYCDALKNDDWQGYASAAAAAYARELFFHLPVAMEENVRPRHFIVPFTQNRNFVGREIFLEELRVKLCVDDGPRRLAITGLGGIGKTQVALQTAFWLKENRPTWSIFWAQAYSMSAFEKACNGIIDRAGIQVAKDEDPKEAVQRFLNSRDAGNWLLIVDNADDGQTMFRSGASPGINNFLPANEDGRILFTSRFKRLAFELAGKEILELEKMTTSEARKFFEQLMPEESARPIGLVEDLLAQLEHLPLAISQAAAHLRNNCISTSIEDYLSTLRGTEKEAAGLLSREYRDHTRYDDEDIGHAVATTWLVSFRHMEQMTDSEAAMALLKFISQIGPASIPMDLLPRRNTEDLHCAIGILASFAFLERRPGTNLLYMHPLVHLASRIWFEKKGLAGDIREFALIYIRRILASRVREDSEFSRACLPHALKLLESRGTDRSWGLNEARLARLTATFLTRDYRLRESTALLEDTVAACRRTLQPDATILLELQSELGMAYGFEGQVKKPVKLLEHVVKALVETRPKNDPRRRVHQYRLAGTYRLSGRANPESDKNRLSAHFNVAQFYCMTGQLTEAVELLEHAIPVCQDTQAENRSFLLSLQVSLGKAYFEAGRHGKATEIIEHAVKLQGEAPGELYSDRQQYLQYSLAIMYEAAGRVEEAIQLLNGVVAVRKKTLPEGHAGRINAERLLARMVRRMSETQKDMSLETDT
ncbi:uncharacterized protein LY79DRAFT_606958 [Colletotrichum navitas]|uniref:Kinesin light chain n=1 Tax=Colletotrichum navitas TaxID=681940 RepID=A0AAD8PZ38_9PEZI|nr:uncharacterized protein LY79DRAFT_606958 [Colletotrichum navitas]KAK1590690.1 hypothetical protein LY79DRAFT_606958 [Colletotrichum navitas]